jgi:hypothetical protein
MLWMEHLQCTRQALEVAPAFMVLLLPMVFHKVIDKVQIPTKILVWLVIVVQISMVN